MNPVTRSRLPGIVVVLGALLVAAPAAAQSPSAPPAPPAHWTQEGAEGPAHWGELDPGYVTCADGTSQSPIDVANASPADLADPVFAYQPTDAQVVNTGHSIQANAAPGSTVSIDGVDFGLAQIHFHAPSEHTVDGFMAPVEVHFVHKTADGETTVVGVLLIQGDEPNTAWEPYVEALGVARDAERTAQLDWPAMLPSSRLSIRYTGSLTTPPCSEPVHWLVMTDPVKLSADQIEAFTTAYEGNHRPVQPLDGRPVEIDTTEG